MTYYDTEVVFNEMDGITRGIGGSDISVILGLSKNKSAADLAREILGKKSRFAGNNATLAGGLIEEPIAQWYERKTGANLIGPFKTEVDGWYRRSPDRLDLENKTVVECKSSLGYQAKNIWGDESQGEEGIPDYYNCQPRWYMAKPFNINTLSIHGSSDGNVEGCHEIEAMWAKLAVDDAGGEEWVAEKADFAVWVTGPDLLIFTIYHDQNVVDTMMEEAEKFWNKYIIKGKVPPEDYHSKSTQDHVRSLFAQSTDIVRAAPSDIERIAHAYRENEKKLKVLKAEKAKLADEQEAYKAQVFNCIGEDKGIKGSFGTWSWLHTERSVADKDTLKQNLAKEFGVGLAKIDEVFRRSKKTVEYRRSHIKWSDNK